MLQEDDWLDSVDRYKELPDTAPPVAPPSAKRKRSQRPPPKHSRDSGGAPAAGLAAQRPAAAGAAEPRIAGGVLAAVQATLQPLPSGSTPRSDVQPPESGPSGVSEQTRDGGAVSAAGPAPLQPGGAGSTAADGPPHTPMAKRRKRMVVKVTPSKAAPEGAPAAAAPTPGGGAPQANQLKRPMWPKGPARANMPGSGSGVSFLISLSTDLLQS